MTRALPDDELDEFVEVDRRPAGRIDRTSLASAKAMVNRASLPPEADLAAAYGEFAHSLTLPGFLARADGAAALAGEGGIEFEYRLGEYLGVANQQR